MTRSAAADAQRYEALKRAVAHVGLLRRGSLVRRFMPCGKSGCRCQAQPPQLHGPYYQWTRKVSGTTVTVRLGPREAALVAEWIDNGRRLDRIVKQMEQVAGRLTERELRACQRTDPDDSRSESPGRPPARPHVPRGKRPK